MSMDTEGGSVYLFRRIRESPISVREVVRFFGSIGRPWSGSAAFTECFRYGCSFPLGIDYFLGDLERRIVITLLMHPM